MGRRPWPCFVSLNRFTGKSDTFVNNFAGHADMIQRVEHRFQFLG